MVHLPSRAPLRSCHAHRLLALVDQARRLEHAHPLGGAHRGCDEAMGRRTHQVCIPDLIAPAAWPPPAIAPGNAQGHRCDGCAFQRTALADPGGAKVLAGLTAGTTGPAWGMEGVECIKESLHITSGAIKRRDGALLALRAPCWQPLLSPAREARSLWRQRRRGNATGQGRCRCRAMRFQMGRFFMPIQRIMTMRSKTCCKQ